MSKIISEKEYVIRAYAKHPARNKKLAIYGIGKNTEIVLNNFDCSNVIGLLDGVRTDGELFGKSIITCSQAIEQGAEAIIIIGRAANVKIIYRRIVDLCTQYDIPAYDINGDILGIEQVEERIFDQYMTISKQSVIKLIDNADIVSFDIFDTLLMRRTLYPRDIFELAEKQLGTGFAKERIEAEMALYRNNKNPTIYDIYNNLNGYEPNVELELERKNLITRKSIIEIFKYVVNEGKLVYLVSDMYLTTELLSDILSELGITVSKKNILVSCEYGVSKSTGLFNILREKAGGGKIVHIGDNYEADISSAKRYGIDAAFQIESAVTMLSDSYAADVLKYDDRLENRLLIGHFISEQLNDPFLFSISDGKFAVDTNYAMAYSFFAPIVLCFFAWLSETAHNRNCDRVLLASRDGYLIEKIQKLFFSKGCFLPRMEYFYTSRAVAVVASLIDDDDILHAARLAFTDTVSDMLKERFLLTNEEILARKDKQSDEDYILAHREPILRHAATMRKKYKNYIKGFNIPAGVKVGFFDFVSSGTCQKGLMNFVDFDLVGLYFAAINYEAEYKNHADIQAMYGVLNVFAKNFKILENYISLESIMTSHEPTLCGFKHGEPFFLVENRSKCQIKNLKEIHNAILEYANDISEHFKLLTKVDKSISDLLLSFLDKKYSNISCGWFEESELEDEFCKRKFKLSI